MGLCLGNTIMNQEEYRLKEEIHNLYKGIDEANRAITLHTRLIREHIEKVAIDPSYDKIRALRQRCSHRVVSGYSIEQCEICGEFFY